jgi:catechol 2,3-dioxygenase-like lactoylglutathione lyase family enzyme
MGSSGPVFNQINLVVRDMAAMVEFYERLGVDFRRTLPEWEPHHRTLGAEHMVEGFDFDLDSQAFAPRWNEGWPADRAGPVFGFRLPSNEAVDATYAELTGAGYTGQQSPWDGFMGARYAVVVDPDGNSVGLMGPIDKTKATMPPLPEG